MLRLAAVSSLVLLAGCRTETPAPGASGSAAQDTAPSSTSLPFRIDGQLDFVRDGRTLKTIDIEIADTDSTRARGLMERSQIPPDTGMLFIFPSAGPQSFYMASTPKSLDIQFYGPDSTLLNIAEDAVPYDFTGLPSDGPAQFVVEVPAGYSRRIGLVPGDRIRWTDRRALAADTLG